MIEESDDEYPLNFQNSDDLLEIFGILEEGNLFLIQQGQESEQVLDTKKHELEFLRTECDKEMGKLQNGEDEIKERIHKNQQEREFLQNTTMVEQNKVIDANTFSNIDLQVRELYSTVLGSKAEGKMNNSSTLQLLNEVEKEIDNFLFEF